MLFFCFCRLASCGCSVLLPVESFLNSVFITVPCSFTLSHSLTMRPAETKCSTSRSAITCKLEITTRLIDCSKCLFFIDLILPRSDFYLLVRPICHIDFSVQDIHHGWVIIHILYTPYFQRQRFPFCDVPVDRQQKLFNMLYSYNTC